MCAAAVGQYGARGFFQASCCHDKNLLWRASSRAMGRYTADSGSALKERKCGGGKKDGRRGEKAGWMGSDRVCVWDIMSIYAETHVQDLLTFFWVSKSWTMRSCGNGSRQLP